MGAVLVLALAVPAAVAGALAVPRLAGRLPWRGTLVAWACVAAAAAWLAVLVAVDPVAGGAVEAGRFAGDATVAGTGVAAMLLAAAASRRPRADAVVAVLVAVAAMAGLSASAGEGHAGDLVAGLAVAAVVAATVLTGRSAGRRIPPAAALAAVGLVAAGARGVHDSTGSLRLVAAASPSWDAAVALVAGGAALAWAGARMTGGAGGALAAAGLAVVARTSRLLDGHDAADLGALDLDLAAAVGLGLAAAGLVAATPLARSRPVVARVGAAARLRGDPVSALVLWAAAALVSVPDPQPGLLLAAAALLTALAGLGAAAVAAVPGAAALAVTLAQQGGSRSAALAGLAAATAAALVALLAPAARRRARPLRAPARHAAPRLDWLPEPRLVSGAALALAAWLVVAPGTWGWTGGGPFGAWHRAAVVAAAAGALGVVAAARGDRLATTAGLAALPHREPPCRGRAGLVAVAGAAAGMGLAVVWLVLSVGPTG